MGHPQHQMPPAHVSASGHGNEDSQWEYEYDESETEDWYLTLDLTTHVPDALTRKYDTAIARQPARKSPSADTPEGDAAGEERQLHPGIVHSRPRPVVQILDLHTRNPLVKFDGGIYSCYWSTDLGTQFHIAQAGVAARPTRAGTVLDVIGLSQARLIGKPVTLKQKNAHEQEKAHSPPPESGTVDLPDGDDEARPAPSALHDPTQPLVIPRELCKDSTAEAQASFLEQLSQIKLKRGETDPVPMYSIRIHRDPANKDDLRKHALQADAERRQEEAAVAADNPRKRRKRLTAVEKGLIPDDAPKALSGRQDRAALGARVGFEGHAPGALATNKKKSKKKRRHPDETEADVADNAVGGGEVDRPLPPAEQDSNVQMDEPHGGLDDD